MTGEESKPVEDGLIEAIYSCTGNTYVFSFNQVLDDPTARMLWELIEDYERLRRDYEWMQQQPPTTTAKLLILHVSGKLDGLREALDKILPVLGTPYLKAGDPAM
jgi:hypothetical protein